MLSSPPMRMGEWVYFSGPVGYLLFYMDTGGTPSYRAYGGVTIRDFPGGTPEPISCQIDKCRSIKPNLSNCHREVCRIKFDQIVTSGVLISL